MRREPPPAKIARLKKIIAALDQDLSRGALRVESRRPAPIAYRHDSFRAMHRQTRQYRHGGIVQKISLGGGLRKRATARSWSRPSRRRVFFATRRKTSRPAAANWSNIMAARCPRTMEELTQFGWCRAQDGQCCFGQRVRHQCRRGRGHARGAIVASARIDEAEDAGEN